ncbi:MAG: hypothetical protein MUF04_00530 [Akkermansiaceae bacterium]|nr:hypothetical protein [Akkermansiaceae bacterium]
MSDQDPSSHTPSKQTASVPLKKETVRVTLKAADAPPAAPMASVPGAPPAPPTAPPAPPVATAPRPPAPPVPSAPVPAPTIPLRPAGAPTAPAPAPTIKLATSTAPVGAPTIALKTATQPLGTPGGAPSLPKATVQLQAPTQPLTAGTASASQLATFEMDEEEESGAAGFIKVLSIVGFIAACVLAYFQFDIASTWINASDRDELMKGDFMQLFEEDPNG